MSFRNPKSIKPPLTATATTPALTAIATPPVFSGAAFVPGLPAAPAGPVRPVPLARERRSPAFFFLLIFIFLIYSRAPEIIGAFVGALRLPLLICIGIGIATFMNHRFSQVLQTTPSKALLAFTLWFAAAITTSVWRSESARIVILQWPLQVATFYCTAVLAANVRNCYSIARAMMAGVLFMVAVHFIFGASIYGRATMSVGGTLSNPNLLALQLLMGLPFCLAVIEQSGLFSLWGLVSAVSLVAGIYVVGTTGSRSGLIAFAVGLLILMIHGSVLTRLKIVVAGIAAFLLLAAILPHEVVMRYLLLFQNRPVVIESLDVASAVDSAEARKRHIEQSIELTIANPLLGVGPGQFKTAAATMVEKKNGRADWLETHNSFTQISSEAGLPALLAYVVMIGACLRGIWKLYRGTRRNPRLAYINNLAFYFLVSFLLLLITTNFASVAYQTYFPLMCGFAVALIRCGNLETASVLEAAPAPAPRPATANGPRFNWQTTRG